MSAPNIVNISSIYGKTSILAVTTSASAIVENTASSNKVIKINSLVVSNIDDTNAASLTVDLYRSSNATHIIKAVVINPKTSFTPIDKNISIYLEEGDSLRLTANANNDLEAICSYEEIT